MSEKHPAPVLEREDIGGVTILRLKLPMLIEDEPTSDAFKQASMTAEAGRSRIVLNLSGVGFVASAGLGKLITLMRTVQAAGGRLVLCNLDRPIEDLLRVTHLADVLLVYNDEREAVRSFE